MWRRRSINFDGDPYYCLIMLLCEYFMIVRGTADCNDLQQHRKFAFQLIDDAQIMIFIDSGKTSSAI